MTSVRRQIYLSKAVADRWVVMVDSSLGAKTGSRGGSGMGMTLAPKQTMILAVVSAVSAV